MIKDKLNILIIEDNIDYTNTLLEYLNFSENPKFLVTHFVKLSDAITFLQSNTVDVILLDLYLPDSQGVDTFLNIYKQFHQYSYLVMTGHSDDFGEKLISLGAQDFLIKTEITQSYLIKSIIYAYDRNEIRKIHKEQRNKFENLLQIADVFILILDLNGNIELINKKGLELLGYEKSEDVINKNWFESFLVEDEVDKIKNVFDGIISGNELDFKVVNNRIRTRDGKKKLIRWSNTYLRDINDNIIGTLSSGEDITDLVDHIDKVNHLNKLLFAVREINRLIVKEKDYKVLLKKVCSLLVENRGFNYVSIILIDKNLNPYECFESKDSDYMQFLLSNKFVKETCIDTIVHFSGLIYNDIENKDCQKCPIFLSYPNNNVFSLKLKYQDTLFGIIKIVSPTLLVFSELENELLVELSNDVAFALYSFREEEKNEKLQNEIKKNNERLESLFKLNLMYNNNEDEIIDFALEEAIRLTDSKIGYIHFVNENQISLKLFHWSKEARKFCSADKEQEYPLDKAGIWADCARLRKPVIHNDYKTYEAKKGLPEGHIELFRHMSIPVFDEEKIVAICGVGNKEDPYTNENVNQLYLFMNDLWKIIIRKRMNEELIKAKDKAEEMNRIKSNFLANLSHELRTPLMGIIGYADIIAKEVNTLPWNTMALGIRNSGNRLLNTFDLLIDLSKIESENLTFDKSDILLYNLIEEIIEIYRPTTFKKNIKLEFIAKHKDIIIHSDASILKKIFDNILNNAIKFTKVGGINIELKYVEQDDRTFAVITISDSGIGIEKEKSTVIFEEFRQASEGLNRSYEGMGLGLTLVKKFLTLLDGTIDLNSEREVGTVVTIKLPCQSQEINHTKDMFTIQNAVIKNLSDLIGFKNLRALVVEDDLSASEILSIYLSDLIQLDIVEDGETALKLSKQKQYDIIFMDINLRFGLNGIEVTKLLRQTPNYRDIPIIAVTAYAMTSDRERFLKDGCSHFLPKPYSREDLLKLLYNVFKGN